MGACRGTGSGFRAGGDTPIANAAASAGYTTADQTVETTAPAEVVQKSTYRDGVLSVSAVDGGGISVSTLRGARTGSEHDTNSNPEYRFQTNGAYIDIGKAGFESDYSDDRDATVTRGVNWDNVRFVTGDTFKIKSELKSLGFRWNGQNRRWEK